MVYCSNQAKKYRRDEQGFTLAFAVVLCLIFATLLASVYYFLGLNTKHASKGITKLQTMYLAESGNNRALSRLNVKSLPEITTGLVTADEEDAEADESSDFFDEEAEDDDEDLTNVGDDLSMDDEDEEFLSKIPRYINFYHKNPFYVNIDSGQRITEAQYYSMIQDQQLRLKKIREESNDPNDVNGRQEIPIQELYFPLPEVNVQKIGSIPIEKGVHLKPGFRLVLAEKSPIKLKQENIVDEYFNYIPAYVETRAKPVLRGISPNYAYPGEYIDIRVDGDNIENIIPEISSADIVMMDASEGLLSVDIKDKIKPGRYTIKIGPAKAEFYIVPPSTTGYAPSISDIRLTEERDGNPQFIKMFSKDTLEGVRIIGQDLSDGKDPPVIVVDGIGITIDVVSHKPDEIVCNIKTEKAIPGSHYLVVYTKGGSSNSWIFNVEKTPADIEIDPFTGTYSTVLTLLEVNSLSNLPLKSVVESSPSGRPQKTGTDKSRPNSGTQGTNRPGAPQNPNGKRNFDLLRSDMETVWKLETIATVNRMSYKETQIVRRSAPRAGAAITTNTGLTFGQTSLVVSGATQALTNLVESSSSGDTTIEVTGVDPAQALFAGRDDNKRPPLMPTGAAVIENLGLGIDPNTPKGKGFTPGSIIAINSSRRGGQEYSDYSILKATGGNTLTVKSPGFQNSHFLGDEVIQFIPSVITPDELNERDAQRGLDPPGSFINLTGKTAFDYVFRTRLDRMSNWSNAKTTSTSVPNDIKLDYEGYFGLNIIEGVPDYTGGNALYGQGALIIDTTLDGQDPTGGTVSIGGSSKLPSLFDGLIYIIGNLQITGPTEIRGAIIVQSPIDGSSIRLGGSGTITYDLDSIHKAILHLPFTTQINSRVMEASKGEDEILKKDK